MKFLIGNVLYLIFKNYTLLIQYFKNQIYKLDIHTLEVVEKSSASMVVKIFGMILGLLISIFLGRTLGSDGLGLINLANQVISLVLVFAFLGMFQIIIKEVAISHGEKNWKHVGDIMYSSYLVNGGVTMFTTILLILVAPWVSVNIFHEPALTYPLVIGAIVMTPQIFVRIFSSGLIGYKKIWQSNLVEQTLSTIFVAIALLTFWLANLSISVNIVAMVYAFSRCIAFIASGVYWRRIFKNKDKRTFIGWKLVYSGIPLLIVSASVLISSNADSLMIGWLNNTSQVGLYNVASKLALLTSFFLSLIISTVAPKIAVLYNDGNIEELEQMLRQVNKGLTIIGVVSLLFFVFVGKYILGFWGKGFIEAYNILIVLAIGQLVNIASGPIGNVLIMTGHQKIIRNITLVTVLINIILNYFLIQNYQALGAAITTSLTVVLNVTLCYYFVVKKTGIKIIKF